MTTLLIVTLGNYSFLKHKWLSFLNKWGRCKLFKSLVQWWHFQLGLLNIFVISKRLWQIYEKTINKFKPYAICFLVLYLFTRIELFFNDGFLPYDWQMENQSIEPTWWRSFSPPAINKRYIKKSENQIHLFFDPSILNKSCL